jgi:hypothetical protein
MRTMTVDDPTHTNDSSEYPSLTAPGKFAGVDRLIKRYVRMPAQISTQPTEHRVRPGTRSDGIPN